MSIGTMRASVLHGPHVLRLEDRPVPRPGPDEVLVRISAVGVCGSDIHYYEHGRIGSAIVHDPMILGHEASGVVVDVGRTVATRRVGQRVSLEPGVPCRTCEQCLSGHYNLCPAVRFFATPPVDGAFVEYVTLPAAFAHPVPDDLSDDAAALIEPLSVGVWAGRRAAISPGDRVLVTGAGAIGLLAAQVARAFGAAEVTITDLRAGRLDAAARLGLNTIKVTENCITDTCLTPTVLLECSGDASATYDAVRIMAPAGRVVLIGIGGCDMSLPMAAVQGRELTLTGVFRYAGTWPAAIGLAMRGAVDLDALVTGHYALDDVESALTAPARGPSTVKPIVLPAHRRNQPRWATRR